jgi:hypothetical protein
MDIVGAGMPALQEAIDAMPVTDHLTFLAARLPQAKGSRSSSACTRLCWLGWMTG